MNEQKARELVVKAGLDLISSGLIARTWGNVSCRLDGESFVITPSGRAYESLKPEDLVVCKIADASYEGSIKPSSEKKIHALIYRMKKGVGFVIHTHQNWASAVAAANLAEMGGVPVAAYGLPGTKKLLKAVEDVIGKASESVLLRHHGAVCFGADCDAVFASAGALEEWCKAFIIGEYQKQIGRAYENGRKMFSYLAKAQSAAQPAGLPPLCGASRRDGAEFILNRNGDETQYRVSDAALSGEAGFHAAVYRARPDVGFIEASNADAVMALAVVSEPIMPMLDDFAQIMGSSVRVINNGGEIAKGLAGKRSGVILAGMGALAFGKSAGDARAARLVMEKTAAAQCVSKLFPGSKPIPAWECLLMNAVYKASYSKRA